MAKHRSHSIEFKRQVVQEFISGETLHSLAKRHTISRATDPHLGAQYEEGAFEDDAQADRRALSYAAAVVGFAGSHR